MSQTIFIPSALRKFTGEIDAVVVAASTVGKAMEQLTAWYPDLKKHFFDDSGKLRDFINVFLGEEDIVF